MNQINTLYKLAQTMRGHVKEYDENYINTNLPKEIVEKLWEHETWQDKDGFIWSFGNVCASKDKTGIYITYANKSNGHGNHETKIYRPNLHLFSFKTPIFI